MPPPGRSLATSAGGALSSTPRRLARAGPSHHDLEELLRSRPERAGAGEQVVLPPSVERVAVARVQRRPCGVELAPPSRQRHVVVLADVRTRGCHRRSDTGEARACGPRNRLSPAASQDPAACGDIRDSAPWAADESASMESIVAARGRRSPQIMRALLSSAPYLRSLHARADRLARQLSDGDNDLCPLERDLLTAPSLSNQGADHERCEQDRCRDQD